MYKDFLIKVLSESSEIATNSFGKVVLSDKAGDNNQVLTETDLEIGRYIVEIIKKDYPDHNIVDEEAGVIDNKSSFTWVVDPIDGTSNFANGLPNYGTMVGLLNGAIPIAGGIVLPFYKEMYLAEKGKGAFCNGNKITVSKEERLLKSLVVYQIDGHQENPDMTKKECNLLADIILNIRNLRTSSSVFDLCNVASGKYGAILNQTSKIWDNVAQQILIEEAGGIYTDFYGKQIDYSEPIGKSKNNFIYCAASPMLHKQLMSIINQ